MYKYPHSSFSLLSALVLSLSLTSATMATEGEKQQLEEKLTNLREENNKSDIENLKKQIATEEERKAQREGTAPQVVSTPQPVNPEQNNEESTWVRERNRVLDQANDKIDKLKKLF